MTSRAVARHAVMVCAALLGACGGDDAKLFTDIDDTQSLETGELKTITLRKGNKVTTLTFPVMPTRQRVTVNLVSGVVKRGCSPLDDSAVQVLPPGLAFTRAVKMSQTVPPPAPRRHHAAVQIADGDDTFVERSPGRRVDDTSPDGETWEADVDGSGIWAFCESSAAPGSNGGPNNGVVEDEAIVRLGAQASTVVLGTGPRRTYVAVPAQPPPFEAEVQLQLLSGVMRMGSPPPNDAAVRVARMPVPAPNPMRAQQEVTPPPPGKTYAVAETPDDGTTWTPMAAARQVPSGGVTPDGGIMAATTEGKQRWEMELPRAGIYALVLVDGTGPTPDGGAPDGGTPDGGEGNPDGGAPTDGPVVMDRPAVITATPGTLDFGSLVTGSTSAALEVTLTNAGTLHSGAPTAMLGGADAPVFTIASNGCTAALPGGGTCKLTLTFKPTATGARNASLTVSATPGGTTTGALSGTGQAPGEIRVNPGRIDFGSIVVGATSNASVVTVTNPGDQATGAPSVTLTGADASSFAIAGNGCAGALAPAATCQIQVTFKPTAAGARNASLVVSATPGGQTNVALAGTGLAPASVQTSPGALTFGGVESGKSSTSMTLRLTNAGGAPTGVIAAALTGTNATEFAVVSDGCVSRTIAGGATCDVVIAFAPSSVGPKTAAFQLSSTPGGATSVALSGTGLAPAALSITGSGAFGNIVVGSNGAAAFTVTNAGGVTTGVPAPNVSGANPADFVISKNTCTAALAAGATCSVEVTFTPAATGPRSATLTVSASPGGAPTASLAGTGIAPGSLSISPLSATLPATMVGSASASTSLTVTNQGGAATGVPTPTITGTNAASFTIVLNGCTAALAPGGTCTIDVRFAPSSGGAQAATLGVAATPGGMATAGLSGQALNPATLKISPDAADFGSSDVGATAMAGNAVLVNEFTVTNAGDVASGLVSIMLGGNNPGDFGGTANKCARTTLAPGASCTFGTTFTPTALGNRNAVVTASASPGGSVSATLKGNGTGAQLAWSHNGPVYDFGTVYIQDGNKAANIQVLNLGDKPSGPITFSLSDTTNFGIATRCTNSMIDPGKPCDVTIGVIVKNAGMHSAILGVSGFPGGTANLELRVTEQNRLVITRPIGQLPVLQQP